MIQLIEKLRKDGSLDKLVRAGLMSTKVYQYHEIAIHYDIFIKQGFKKMDAHCLCEEMFKCSQNKVYRALRLFRL